MGQAGKVGRARDGAEGAFQSGGIPQPAANHSFLHQLGMLSVSFNSPTALPGSPAPFCAKSPEVAFHKQLAKKGLFPVAPSRTQSNQIKPPDLIPRQEASEFLTLAVLRTNNDLCRVVIH